MPYADKTESVTALVPTFWANMMQVPLRKSLVAEAVADTQFEPLLKYGDKVTQPYMVETSVQTYAPGVAFTAQGSSALEDTLTVDQFKVVPTYVDDIRALQAKYSYAMDEIDNQAYQLKDDIDTAVLKETENASLFLHSSSVNTGTIVTAASIADVTGASALKVHAADSTVSAISPIELFSRARRELRQKNVEEAGDWIAVIDPAVAQIIEMIGAEKGFNVADATLRNGYAGNFLGFKIYISNNLANVADGKLSYFGKSKRIGLVTQMPPSVQFKDDPRRLGQNIVTSIVYGTKVFTKNAQRFLGIPLTT